MNTSMVWARPSWRQAWRAAGAMLLCVALVACGGGGGDSGKSVFDPGTGTNPNTPSTLADLAVVADKTSVPNSGAEVVTFTVTALTSGNAALTGVETPVTVEVESGAIVTPSAKVTSKDTGKITAVVQITDKTSRTVKLNVSSGSVKKTASFEVVDSVNGSKVADLRLVVDKVTLPNDGTQVAKLSVTSVDAFNSAIGGSPVSLALIDPVAGGSIVNAFGKTSTDGTSGVLAADISLVTSKGKTNRSITVQATSGTVVRTISFDVVEAVSIVPKASDLTMTLSRNTVGNAGSEPVDVVVTAVDALRNAVPGIRVIVSVDSGAILVPGNLVTDSTGVARASVLIGADRSNRTVTVTATSDTLVRRAAFKVTGTKLLAQVGAATVVPGQVGKIEYSLADVNQNAMADVPVKVSEILGPAVGCSSGAKPAEPITDKSGKYLFCFQAPSESGLKRVEAFAGGVGVESFVQVSGATKPVPEAVVISSATFTASPNVVSVNAVGETENRSDLRLLFRGARNEAIENVRVKLGFGLNNSGTDAKISSGQGIIISDANGVALSSFVPGQRASSTDQVKVFACYGKTDAEVDFDPIDKCPVERLRSVSLTVVETPVSISIGTNGLIGVGVNKLTYFQDFTVLVVDSAGRPKSDVQVSPLLDLPSYFKGYWRYDLGLKRWIQVPSLPFDNFGEYDFRRGCINEDNSAGVGYRNGTIETFSEDKNGNGVLDPGEDLNSNGLLDLALSEDLNQNGQLDPRKSDVAITMVGSTRTDANGLAVLRIEYPQSYGSWVEFSIRVSASGVVSPPAFFGRNAKAGDIVAGISGIPQVTSVPIDVVKSEGDPPFRLSPYGRNSSCLDSK